MALLPFETMSGLEPTVQELISLLSKAAGNVGFKPSCLLVDSLPAVEPMQKVLVECGMSVYFYPPPSEEEGAHLDRMNPYTSRQQVAQCCAVCGAEKSSQLRLKICTRCQRVLYCSVEHQKEHWKEHKKECKKTF